MYKGDKVIDPDTGEVTAGGKGFLTLAAGRSYRGDFKANKFDGYGVLLHELHDPASLNQLGDDGHTKDPVLGDVKSYEGQWKNGLKEGEGTECYYGQHELAKLLSDHVQEEEKQDPQS